MKIFKHKKIEYISYPYEWSFSRLKDAALHHLKLHLNLLKHNATLVDFLQLQYSIRFFNLKIYYKMSIREYKKDFENGHKQFCESF